VLKLPIQSLQLQLLMFKLVAKILRCTVFTYITGLHKK